MNQKSEEKARDIIDKKLDIAGWIVQDNAKMDFSAGIGIALRELQTDSGPADYILFVNRKPCGVIEAKKFGTILTPIEEQTERYAKSKITKLRHYSEPLRFLYETTGLETHFTDTNDPKPRAREIFQFHRPETLKRLLEDDQTLRMKMREFPKLERENLRDCQFTAIENLENSFRENKPRALVQMATGAGKTFTAITSIYRLLEFAKAKRILFLVDTKNLGEQAEKEFQAYTPQGSKRKFTDLYVVQRLTSNSISPAAHVCISTIQRMYSILRGEKELILNEEKSLNEGSEIAKPVDVKYNPQIPIEMFDIIIIDECHRSIYNLWKQVLDYFDAFLIGLTATPDNRTFGFFDKNVVSEYPHQQAVADGVNVGYDVYTIETKITSEGAKIEAKQFIDKRDKLTRQMSWEQVDEEVTYAPTELDSKVVNPDQIRTIVKAFKEKINTEIFPNRKEVPKTLIFAKTDSHAEDIIKIVREEFGEGNAFCKKVTYGNTEEKPSEVLQQFRTAYNPRIAVTVDMIATGTDVKAIECLLFLRDVRSKNYFQQMLGRGTRTFSSDDLKRVTPSAVGSKTHFVVVDAVGVCKSLKVDSRPLERKPNVSLKDLVTDVMFGNTEEDTFISLANRLSRMERRLSDKERQDIVKVSGESINETIHHLLAVYDPDQVEIERQKISSTATEEQARKKLIEKVQKTFDKPEYREKLFNIQKSHFQIIDKINIDEVTSIGWDADAKEKAKALISEFKDYLEENKDKITALQIFYSFKSKKKDLTFQMIQDLSDIIRQAKPKFAPLNLWKAFEQLETVEGKPERELTALVAIIRRVLEIDPKLTSYDITVNKNFQRWIFAKHAGKPKFSDEQMEWLRMMKDFIAISIRLEKDDLAELPPFSDKGGLGKAKKLFPSDLTLILEELNAELVA